MSTPLTDRINALTTYSNTVTGASDTTLSEAVATLAAGYGTTPPRLLYASSITMDQTYTATNPKTVQIAASDSCVILVIADATPSPPSSGYTALSWYCLTPVSNALDGRIIRSNGTVGTDAQLCTYEQSTGALLLGGQYGYFREGDTYNIYQFGIGD